MLSFIFALFDIKWIVVGEGEAKSMEKNFS